MKRQSRSWSSAVAPALGMAALCSGLVMGCREAKETDLTRPVARVGEAVITVADLEAELARRARASALAQPANAREVVLDDLVRHQVLLARARAAGLDQQPEVRRQMERVLVARFEAEQGPVLDRLPTPTETEIAAAYEERRAQFAQPERLRVAVLVLRGSAKATPERQKALRARANRLRETAATGDGNAFATLIRQHSEDQATRYAGGDAGWIEAGAVSPWPEAVIAAGRALEEPGALSPVVEAGHDLYLVRLTERRVASVRPLADVRDRVVHELIRAGREQAERQFDARLREGLAIQINRDLLAKVPLPAAPLARSDPPPALPAR